MRKSFQLDATVQHNSLIRSFPGFIPLKSVFPLCGIAVRL